MKQAKERVLGAAANEPWLVGVGIGLVGEDRRPGVVVSVSADGQAAAEALLAALALDVPVRVRVTGPIVKR